MATVPGEITGLRLGVMANISGTALTVQDAVRDADARVDQAIRTLDRRAASLQAGADKHLGVVEQITDARLREATGALAGLRGDLQPTLRGVAATTAATAALVGDLQASVDDLYPDIKASVESVTVAAASAGYASEDFRRAVPVILDGAQRIVANSDRTTASTAEVMANLARATRPLPAWARVALAVAPPMAQTGFTVASWAAIRGK